MQLSTGSWSILFLALVSTICLAFLPINRPPGHAFWTFSLDHDLLYEPVIREWNQSHPDSRDHVTTYVIDVGPLQQRLQSGFLSGTPVPDLAEVERSMIGSFFSGPLDAVGFADLTDIIHRDKIDQEIIPASFAPWTNRGRIFGLPHDVHPVLLAYRADVVEAAGIDVTKIETWDDFVRVMTPLMKGPNGTRYLLNVWETNPQALEILILQAGGDFFDPQMQPTLNSDINARVLARIVTWIAGPGRICVNAPDFDANGNHMFAEGLVLCTLMPDWLGGVWMKDLPSLGGKIKLMPLPAWQRGGLRTSVYGGTMLGIPRRSKDFQRDWEFARHLYLSREVARDLYRTAGIITPVRKYWDDPVYDAPNPYFCGQPNGRLYIQAAPNIPLRTSSPYRLQAVDAMIDALTRLKLFAENTGTFDEKTLQARAHAELAVAQQEVQRKMAANAFLSANP